MEARTLINVPHGESRFLWQRSSESIVSKAAASNWPSRSRLGASSCFLSTGRFTGRSSTAQRQFKPVQKQRCERGPTYGCLCAIVESPPTLSGLFAPVGRLASPPHKCRAAAQRELRQLRQRSRKYSMRSYGYPVSAKPVIPLAGILAAGRDGPIPRQTAFDVRGG